MRRFLTSFALFAGLASVALSQSVRWQSADTGDPSDLELIFENTAPAGGSPPQLPDMPGGATVTYIGPRSETSTSIVNGVGSTRSVVYLMYRARPRNAESFEIPAFTVQTRNGAVKVDAFKVAAPPQVPASVARSTLFPAGASFFAGEVFPLAYTLDVATRNVVQLGASIEWAADPVVAEEWAKPEVSDTVANGENRTIVTYRTRAYAKTPGRITLNSVHQEISIQTGTIGIGFLQQPRLQVIAVTSTRPEITIKPLPTGAPAGFNGAVGTFRLESKIVPESVAVGEPVTWTLKLTGEGNWPDIPGLPARNVSRDFQVVQPQGKRTLIDGKLFEGEFNEDVVLVPTRAGSYDLGPVTFKYFDPKSGKYETATCDKVSITVKPGANPNPLTVTTGVQEAQPQPQSTTAIPAAGSGGTPPPPAPPGVIPGDPLSGTAASLRPLSQNTALWLAVAPFSLVLVYWGALALTRARATDPLRRRRAARDEAVAAIAALRERVTPEQRATMLRKWQRGVTTLFEITHAAPTRAPAPEWSQLWAEADRAIYGPDADLPTNWPDRAESVLKGKRVAAFSPFQLFLPRNIVPLILVASLVLAVATALQAADATASYRKGDFNAAEKAWRQRAAAQTNDWIARHNLALALYQEDKGPEAAAHAMAAFIQNPRDPSVRWHLAPVFEKAAYTPEPLVGFINPNPVYRVARLASPAEWQWILVASNLLISVAAAWLLRGAYQGGLATGARVAAWTLLALGTCISAAALFSGRAYGDAANPKAIISWRSGTLRSIPTEADTTQKTTALSAGTIAISGEAFLGWEHVSFSNGQTGWARKADFVPLW